MWYVPLKDLPQVVFGVKTFRQNSILCRDMWLQIASHWLDKRLKTILIVICRVSYEPGEEGEHYNQTVFWGKGFFKIC